MKLALLTSTHKRHQFVAHILAKRHDLVLIIAEEKGNDAQMVGQDEEETKILRRHFTKLEEVNQDYFSGISGFPADSETKIVARGEINNNSVAELMKQHAVEGIAVFGCGIIHKHIFEVCPGRVVNIHQGLSPYYRGSGTNFWPFVNGELEYVGVTVHYIDAGIDTGGIICHGRPDIEIGDSLHSIGCKTVEVSARILADVFDSLDLGNVPEPIPQWSKGKLYRRKDFNAAAVRKAYNNIDNGMIDRYVSQDQRRIQLIEWK